MPDSPSDFHRTLLPLATLSTALGPDVQDSGRANCTLLWYPVFDHVESCA